MSKFSAEPLWLKILLIGLVAILLVAAVFFGAAGISSLSSGAWYVDCCADIWFGIFPGLKATTETATEIATLSLVA